MTSWYSASASSASDPDHHAPAAPSLLDRGHHEAAAVPEDARLQPGREALRQLIDRIDKVREFAERLRVASHLEGQISGSGVAVNGKYHMADAKTHLRNADTDADMQWDPANPNHSNMDNFCMSCHDGVTAINSLINYSRVNPILMKSGYDQLGDIYFLSEDMTQHPFYGI